MRPLPKDHLTNRLRQLCKGLRHAFATEPAAAALNPDDAEFLDRIADALLKRGMRNGMRSSCDAFPAWMPWMKLSDDRPNWGSPFFT